MVSEKGIKDLEKALYKAYLNFVTKSKIGPKLLKNTLNRRRMIDPLKKVVPSTVREGTANLLIYRVWVCFF